MMLTALHLILHLLRANTSLFLFYIMLKQFKHHVEIDYTGKCGMHVRCQGYSAP